MEGSVATYVRSNFSALDRLSVPQLDAFLGETRLLFQAASVPEDFWPGYRLRVHEAIGILLRTDSAAAEQAVAFLAALLANPRELVTRYQQAVQETGGDQQRYLGLLHILRNTLRPM